MEDWAAIATEISAALETLGFEAVLEKAGVRSGPPWEPVATIPSGYSYQVRVIDKQPKKGLRDGQFAGTSGRSVLMSAIGVVPARGDRVQIRGSWHVIESVKVTAPGGVDLLFECEVSV